MSYLSHLLFMLIHYVRNTLHLHYNIFAIWDLYLNYIISKNLFVTSVGCLCYVRPMFPYLVVSIMGLLLLQLVASTIWDLCHFNCLFSLCKTLVVSVDWFRYVRSTLFIMSPLLCSSLPNRFSSRVCIYFASRQVLLKDTHLLWQHYSYEMKS